VNDTTPDLIMLRGAIHTMVGSLQATRPEFRFCDRALLELYSPARSPPWRSHLQFHWRPQI